MFTILTMLIGEAVAAAPVTQRASEVPELASMALLSVVLAGVSVAVRHSTGKDDGTRETRRDTDRA
jgi:hypothetical protein